ncbi:MAG: glycosyltransferase [Candidatus Methylomirabilis oxyfera]|nr:glycosyltransferase [Candidatus Methylomirabilis oxyfera]
MTPRRKILVIRSVNVHETARALQHLRRRHPDAEISLLLPTHLMEYLAENPHVDRRITYGKHAGGTGWREAITLIRALRKESFDELVVLYPDRSRIANLYDIILFSLCIPAKRRVVLDSHMRESDLPFSHRLTVVLDHSLLIVALPIAALVTVALRAWSPESKRSGRRWTRPVGSSNRVAILIPILPDLSHTFVYREVLAMKRYGADFVLIALEQGDDAVLHPEAKALLEFAILIPKRSVSQYVLYYLVFALTSPRRMVELIRLFQSHARGDPLVFLRISQFHNPFHPVHGIGLAWTLRRLGVTSLHAYGSSYPTTRAMTAACLLDIPFSTTAFVDFDVEYDFRMLPEKIRRSVFFATHTDYCRTRLHAAAPGVDPEKIQTIRIGVDPEQWRPVLSRVEGPVTSTGSVRGLSPDNNNVPKLLAVGRFVEKKGLDILLRACGILQQREVPFQCLLIGDGPEMSRLQSLVTELGLGGKVRFTGAIPTDGVRSYFAPQNVVVAPSVYAADGERDGIPTVLVEAMACGVPAVASAISGIPELIDDGECGLLVPERDEHKLASAIETVLFDPGLRARFRRNGRRKVIREFDVQLNALRLWRMILKTHDRRHLS